MKIKIQKTIIKPIIIYAAETMCLTQKEKEKLQILKGNILRWIIRPKKIQGENYRTLMN